MSPAFIVNIALKRASYADNLATYTDDTWVYSSQEDWAAWDRKALEEDPYNYLHPFYTAMEAFESSQGAISLPWFWASWFMMGVCPVLAEQERRVHEMDQSSSKNI